MGELARTKGRNFGNARDVRKVFEGAVTKLAARVARDPGQRSMSSWVFCDGNRLTVGHR